MYTDVVNMKIVHNLNRKTIILKHILEYQFSKKQIKIDLFSFEYCFVHSELDKYNTTKAYYIVITVVLNLEYILYVKQNDPQSVNINRTHRILY